MQTPRSVVQAPRFRLTGQRFEFGGLAAVVVASVLMIWVAVEISHGGKAPEPAPITQTATSVAELETLAASVKHPVFWVGPKKDSSYELTQFGNGAARIRYVPAGGIGGGPDLTVSTYPSLNPFSVIGGIANQTGFVRLGVPGAGVGAYPANNPTDVYVAYPGVDYQVEVVDPTPGSAPALVTSGLLMPVSTR